MFSWEHGTTPLSAIFNTSTDHALAILGTRSGGVFYWGMRLRALTAEHKSRSCQAEFASLYVAICSSISTMSFLCSQFQTQGEVPKFSKSWQISWRNSAARQPSLTCATSPHRLEVHPALPRGGYPALLRCLTSWLTPSWQCE